MFLGNCKPQIAKATIHDKIIIKQWFSLVICGYQRYKNKLKLFPELSPVADHINFVYFVFRFSLLSLCVYQIRKKWYKMTKLNMKNGKIFVNKEKKFYRISYRGQFHQHFARSFYVHRSLKRNKTAKSSVPFCTFGICFCKSCL